MKNRQRNLRVFGIGLSLICGLLAVRTPFKIVWGAGAFLLLALTLLRLEALAPLYTGWMKVAHVIGAVISRLILILLYGLFFVPAGLILRLTGQDPLNRKLDPNAESYWTPRAGGGSIPNPESYRKPF